jgi:serine protease Do
MKKVIVLLAVILALGIIAGCAQTGNTEKITSSPGVQKRAIDFESIIEMAKSKVFPALVCVKVVFEEYERGERKQRQALGSGVLISPDGYIVTNNHVVEKSTRIKCILYDRRLLPAKLIGRDKDTDLALIKIEPAALHPQSGVSNQSAVPEVERSGTKGDKVETFPFAEYGETTKVKSGDFVMALGAPWGFERSISLGIIGNPQRFIEGYSEYTLWIQTDASINPGNSGGPLINTDGKVIGINTLGGGALGFSIPVDTVKRVAGHLKANKEIKRSWTGIMIQPLRDLDSETMLDRDTGVLVASVDKESPALRAGLQVGDIITSVNKTATNGVYDTDLPEIRWFLGDLPVNQPAVFEIIRGKEAKTITITPREKGKVEGEDFDCKRWDMTVREINEFAEPELFYFQKKGVYVRGIQYPGNARNAGVDESDIIVSVDKKPVTSLDDMKKIYDEIIKDEKREKKQVVLEIMRGGKTRLIILKYDVDYDKE